MTLVLKAKETGAIVFEKKIITYTCYSCSHMHEHHLFVNFSLTIQPTTLFCPWRHSLSALQDGTIINFRDMLEVFENASL